MTGIDELIERCKAATGPDRHLDALIEVEARRHEAYRVGLDDNTRAYWRATIDGNVYDTGTSYMSPHYTASVDATLALVERCLPGWWLHGLGKSPLHGLWWCTLYSLDAQKAVEVEEADTAPLAILSSLLKALGATNGQ